MAGSGGGSCAPGVSLGRKGWGRLVDSSGVEAGSAEDAQAAGSEEEPDEVLLAALQVKEASHSSRGAGEIDEERSTRAISDEEAGEGSLLVRQTAAHVGEAGVGFGAGLDI